MSQQLSEFWIVESRTAQEQSRSYKNLHPEAGTIHLVCTRALRGSETATTKEITAIRVTMKQVTVNDPFS